MTHILVIKHSALGDVVIATAAMKAIRAHHPDAHITLLTTKPYAELLAQSPYFDEIWVDSKPKWYDFKAFRRLSAMLNAQKWAWVYDLQTSTRSTLYQWLFKSPWPHICNVSRWASHGYTDPARHTKHSLENFRIQLALAGIHDIGMPDVSWMDEVLSPESLVVSKGSLTTHDSRLTTPFALLVPGGAAHRPEKRWPAEQFASLATELASKGITPVLIGTGAEAMALESIAARVPAAINLGGHTTISQLATLARHAALAVGNDTGPMHVIAATGCPSTVLFSRASDPVRSAPIGANVQILREDDLSNLSVDRVLSTLTLSR